MDITSFFKISVKNPACIEGLTEDAVRELVNSIEITVRDPSFSGIVTSTGDSQVKFTFGSDGNFDGAITRANGVPVTLINGVNSKQLYIFEGPPSGTNPGVGWEVEPDLTKEVLKQTGAESGWKVFFASRAPVLNTITTT